MKAAIFHQVGKPLSIEEISEPIIDCDEILLKVNYCGICGTDLHCTQKGIMTMNPGTILGHEFSGEVVEIGNHVKNHWKIGDFATAIPANSCGSCNTCRKGYYFLCKNVKVIGLSEYPGAYAEYIKVKSNIAIKLPITIDLKEAALIEPLAIGLHAVDMANVDKTDNILVLGAGPIGLAVIQFLRLAGAKKIIVSEKLKNRREIALKFGANGIIDPDQGPVDEQFKQIIGSSPTIIFECVGLTGLIQECINFSDAHTKIIVVGVCMEEKDTITPLMAILKELSIQFCLGCHQEDFTRVIDLLKNKRLQPVTMISDVIGLKELPKTFEALRTPDRQCKVLLNPNKI